MVNHPNRDLIKRAYDAFGRGNMQLCLAFSTSKCDGMCLVKARCQAIIVAMKQVLGFFQKCMDLSKARCASDWAR